jgi:hypothetical protein
MFKFFLIIIIWNENFKSLRFQQLIFRHFVANHSQVIVLHRLLFYVIQLDF